MDSTIYNLTMQELVTMWVIDFNPVITFTPVSAGIMRLSAYKDGTNTLTYDAGDGSGIQPYDYVGISGSGFRSEANGTLPTPSLTIDKQALNAITQYQDIRNTYTTETGQVFFDWRGAKLTRIRTTSNYLGTTTNRDVDYYIVDQLTRTTSSTIELSLAVSSGADRITSDAVQTLAPNRCALRYRTWNGSSFDYTDEEAGGCPYGNPTTVHNWGAVPDFGDNYFTEQDASTTQEFDKCSYTVNGCRLRFDPSNQGLQLPFLGTYVNTSNDQRDG